MKVTFTVELPDENLNENSQAVAMAIKAAGGSDIEILPEITEIHHASSLMILLQRIKNDLQKVKVMKEFNFGHYNLDLIRNEIDLIRSASLRIHTNVDYVRKLQVLHENG